MEEINIDKLLDKDAVQEQSTDEVSVRNESETSDEVQEENIEETTEVAAEEEVSEQAENEEVSVNETEVTEAHWRWPSSNRLFLFSARPGAIFSGCVRPGRLLLGRSSSSDLPLPP